MCMFVHIHSRRIKIVKRNGWHFWCVALTFNIHLNTDMQNWHGTYFCWRWDTGVYLWISHFRTSARIALLRRICETPPTTLGFSQWEKGLFRFANRRKCSNFQSSTLALLRRTSHTHFPNLTTFVLLIVIWFQAHRYTALSIVSRPPALVRP